MLIVLIDLTHNITPEEAVASLEGNRFKKTEQHLKRYCRDGLMAEAVLDGGLKVFMMKPIANKGNATIADRRWMTMMDFPWLSAMDHETMILKHTIFVTHRVSVICEKGIQGSGGDCVRIEWEFANGVEEDDAERVDWLLHRLGESSSTGSGILLKQLLKMAKLKREQEESSLKEHGQLEHQEAQIWGQNGSDPESASDTAKECYEGETRGGGGMQYRV